MMPLLTCNACNAEFEEEAAQRLHYKSEWHRYNLRRKVAGVPGVTEALFEARQQALANEQKELEGNRMLYNCALCGKEYRSTKAHAQHLKSRAHISRASEVSDLQSAGITVIKPLPERATRSSTTHDEEKEEDSENSEEWEMVEDDDDIVSLATESLGSLDVNKSDSGYARSKSGLSRGELQWDASCCFICDFRPDGTIESCVEHMHRTHGFFIPDAEYLKDPHGLLNYLGLKVTEDFMCLYCNEKRQPFQSLEAVRKHMISKNHCKLHYGDGDEEEDSDLDEFYDYTSSYVDESGMQIVATEENLDANFELGFGGAELVIKKTSENGISSKMLGSREFLRYYRQRPRPTVERDTALSRALVSRYHSMGLATIQSRDKALRRHALKKIQTYGVEAMRTKVGIKNNVIRALPKNVPY
ncbi:cytoplasmic 60S subunit biogenesis factor REI1 homolog 1 isoform X1 [Cryptomeria japonica]|uniref:cytoplasmic 60S subunit biogenesis factor REI1 homolog 1 isoform X1 n=1 Tax=Cryptomeria japonica TaxID=3369 RepID=UPI0025AD1235|nr:cytoplasmic 60S subunit biogenesis factor REI1 homolog 1 isoform X1 [Cryptomeria japonica]